MSGRRSDVSTRIQQKESRALYVHCMGHSLNLAVQDTCRSIKVMADMFDTVMELSKVFKYSAKKKAMLLKLKSELSPETVGIRPLCPTRTVRAESLRSIISNFSVIHSILEEITEEYRGNSEVTSTARGIIATMEKFCFVFALVVGEKVFSLTDILSKAMQRKTMSAVEDKRLAAVTLSSLKDQRCDSCFSSMWKELLEKVTEFDCEEPVLPRKRRAPRRLDEATTSHFDLTPEGMYCRLYFEVLDMITGEIQRRFESPSFTFYAKVESVLESAVTGLDISTEGVKEIVHHFKDDLIEPDLLTELKMLKNISPDRSLFTYSAFKDKISHYRSIFPQTCKLFQLLLVMPATSATAEWSFLSLRHVKTYLRTTMKQNRLNHLMIIYIHKDRKIDTEKAMDEFISLNSERIQVFGRAKQM